MSGKDEKPKHLSELTFQECTECNGFEYWIGKNNTRWSIYFNPIKYRTNRTPEARPVAIYSADDITIGRVPTLTEFVEIRHIECSGCGTKLDHRVQAEMITRAVNYVVR